MGFLTDTGSPAVGGILSSSLWVGMRRDEKLPVLVPVLFWLCSQTHLHLSRQHCDALSQADLSSPGSVKACIAAAEALAGCMNVQIQPGEWRAEIYGCRRQSHQLLHKLCCTLSTSLCCAGSAAAPEPLRLQGGVSSGDNSAAFLSSAASPRSSGKQGWIANVT